MNSDMSVAVIESQGHPVLRVFASFPIACFTCALLTDIAYVVTTNIMWADFSDWLLAVGMVGGVLAALAGLVSLVAGRRALRTRPVWPILLGSLIALVLGFLDNLVHSRDGWTSVMPTGLALSAATVLVMLVTVWFATGPRRARRVTTTYAGARR